jgi:hypothetical protein
MPPPEAAAVKPIEERLVFVGGLHRSGTTPLARWLADHPCVGGLTRTGVYEDEGQHLQSVYPIAAAHGGPGRFTLDPESRLTENSPLVTPDAPGRLLEAWSPFWDASKQVLVEKSPPNLVRMRFLRALFPSARFIVVVRHPVAVAIATRKWARLGMGALLRYWFAGHEHLVEDARQVGTVAVVRYEDLMASPAEELDRLFAFLSLPPHDADWPVRRGINDAYFAQYRPSSRPWRRISETRAARRYEDQAAKFGYSLLEPGRLGESALEIRELRPAPRTALGA